MRYLKLSGGGKGVAFMRNGSALKLNAQERGMQGRKKVLKVHYCETVTSKKISKNYRVICKDDYYNFCVFSIAFLIMIFWNASNSFWSPCI